MSKSNPARDQGVSSLIEFSNKTLAGDQLNRQGLAEVAARLTEVAAEQEWWEASDYPAPDEGVYQARYLIAQDDKQEVSLYLNVMRAGKKILPHDHTTWACIAAVVGVEQNALYDRLDDGSVPGKGELKKRETIDLAPGNALALMPDDIHSVRIEGDSVIRHLHLYGRPLESLSGRTCFDLQAGTCRIMDIGVKTRS